MSIHEIDEIKPQKRKPDNAELQGWYRICRNCSQLVRRGARCPCGYTVELYDSRWDKWGRADG